MKKLILNIIFILFLFSIGCNSSLEKEEKKPTLTVDERPIEIVLGNKINLNIDYSDGVLSVKSIDETIIIVNGNVLEAIKIGATKIIISCSNENEKVEKIIDVIVSTNKISDFNITSLLYLELNKSKQLELDFDNTKNVNFKFEYDNTKLKIENYTVTGLAEGSHKITVTDEYSKISKIVEVIVFSVTEEKITEYINDLYDGKIVDKDITFVSNYYDTNIIITYSLYDTTYLSNNGKYTAPILDQQVELLAYYEINGEEFFAFPKLTIKGWGNEFDYVNEKIKTTVPEETKRQLYLVTEVEEVNAKITWSYLGRDLNNGIFTFERDESPDFFAELKCIIEINGKRKIETYKVKCIMKESQAKADLLFNEIKSLFEAKEINSTISLPTDDERYSAKISWRSYNPDVITNEGKYTKPLSDIEVQFLVIVEMGNFSTQGFVNILCKGENKVDIWERVEAFLSRINKKEIQTHKFTLYGCEPGYEYVPSQNIGYLPFYMMDEVKITEHILPDGSKLKANRMRASTKYISLHNTGMAHPTATAKGLDEYIHSTDRVASWHYSVDDYEAYQQLKLGEVGWHAGDGSRTYDTIWNNNGHWGIGGGNSQSIGIEMCVYQGVDFNMVMRNTAKIVSNLLVMYNLTPASIRQHWDYTGKDCPQVIRQAGRWTEMLELIQLEYYARTQLKGVTFKFESLSKEYLDDTGKVIKNDDTMPTLKYKVTVTYNNISKEYTYESKLLKK